MYSREEAKKIRNEFWEKFKNYSSGKRKRAGKPAKWIMDATGNKAINLKFYFDNSVALVGLDIETSNLDKRIGLFEKLESLKKILDETMGIEMIRELDYTRENGKSISRIYTSINDVGIYNKESWPAVIEFFYLKMSKLEDFYLEYKDYLL